MSKFMYYKDCMGEFRFQLIDDDEMVMCVSNSFRTEDQCLEMIDRIKKNASHAEIIEGSIFNFHEYCKC